MSRWFRHYAGMMRDEKLVAVAVKAKQPVERVLWVWGAILESAAEINDGGRFELDHGEIAYFLRTDEGDIDTIAECLECCGRTAGGCVVNWGSRQYESDTSAKRQSAYRERKRASLAGGGQSKQDGDDDIQKSDVTPPSHDAEVTPPETETETETEVSNPPNPPDEISQAFDAYNGLASEIGLPKAQVLTASRRSALSKRLKDCGGIDGWQFALAKIRGSPFCRGEKTEWKADLDFLLQAKSFTRLMEGSYDGSNNPAKSSLAEKLQRHIGAADEFARRNVSSGG